MIFKTQIARQEKLRQLDADIVSLKSKKEAVGREYIVAIDGLNEVMARQSDIVKEISENEVCITELSNLIQSTTLMGITAIEESQSSLSRFREVIGILDSTIKKQTADLAELRKKQITIHAQIMRDQEELAKKTADLNIYKKRIEDIYKEIAPDKKVII